MKDYSKRLQPLSRTLPSKPKAANQASFAEILQRFPKTKIRPALVSVIQGMWATVWGTGERLNLTDNKDGTYTDAKTGKRYVLHSTTGSINYVSLLSATPAIPATPPPLAAPAMAAAPATAAAPFMPELGTWTKKSTGVRPATPWGKVSATHKRGAPKLSSRASEFGRFSMGDSYAEYVRALRSGGKSDSAIAQGLLDQDPSVLSSSGEQRGAAMLHSTVYLAEEWRKHGAAKIYRGEVRRIAAGKASLDDMQRDFEFVQSADRGRKQVGRFHQVQTGRMQPSALSPPDSEIYETMSPLRDDDFSSDEEERKRKDDAVKKKRIY